MSRTDSVDYRLMNYNFRKRLMLIYMYALLGRIGSYYPRKHDNRSLNENVREIKSDGENDQITNLSD